ncbi:MAG TPA: efflux transporter outer membrane subunit [Steroidobacteraceae bacterium]|jgi:multidrug efflux system outer membrane protein|nr:efflux transporter outer membrane subunit [Steroidobacteraceae bacterium]
MRSAIMIGCLLTLGGCVAGPDFKRPSPPVPEHWSSLGAGSRPDDRARDSAIEERDADLRRWWSDFNDPTLASLIERALAANLDLRVAVLRIEESRAQRAVTAASLWPSLSANASYTRTRLSETTPTGVVFTSFDHVSIPGVAGISIPNPYNQYQLGAQASWELDLFGRVRRSVEAADANLAAAVEEQHAATVSLLGDVARSYLDLRGAQRSAATARESIAITTELLELSRQRRAAGLASEVDVVEAAAELSATQSQLPAFDLAMTQDINQLSRLLGREPDALRAELESVAPIPAVPASVPIGLPASLARRRPDILKAEADLHAATAQIGVAVAGLYPRITLTGAGGVQSETTGELTEWASRFFSLGPTLELPVFDRGRWQTVSLQRVREKEAAVSYANTVLNALQEVGNARAAYDADQDRHAWLQNAVAQNRDALDLTRERYRSGVASFIEVLDAERTLQQNQLSLAQSETAVSEDLVALYRALGGGWETG